MGFSFLPIVRTAEEKRRLDERQAVKERERITTPRSRRPRVSANFSGDKRRSRKRDEFGFDLPE
jgi:hypothetical protein